MSLKYEALARGLVALIFMKVTGFMVISWWLVMSPVWIVPLMPILSGLRTVLIILAEEWVNDHRI